jgi:hypothetical protein|tara:strand:+ start:1203 stop:1895 length:693 start_codon:yes stop_codon:yes gene_type:complete
MSSYVDKDYFYYLRGRELLLYKLLGSRNSDRITQSGVLQSYDNELVYPDEDIANGLRLEYTRVSEPFISEALETTLAYASSISISFTASSKFITTSADVWVSSGFEIGDKIRVKGSSSNDGDYTIANFSGSGSPNIVINESLVDESAEQRIAINQIPKEDASPSSSSHINLNKMLSLAVVDYCKAMVSERNGEIDKKEYFMKEFYSKLADNESNKRIISVASPISAFAVK